MYSFYTRHAGLPDDVTDMISMAALTSVFFFFFWGGELSNADFFNKRDHKLAGESKTKAVRDFFVFLVLQVGPVKFLRLRSRLNLYCLGDYDNILEEFPREQFSGFKLFNQG